MEVGKMCIVHCASFVMLTEELRVLMAKYKKAK